MRCLALALLVGLSVSCAGRKPPGIAAQEFVELRLAHKCDELWSALSRTAQAAATREDYVERCEEAKESALIVALFERTAVRVVSVKKRGRTYDVTLETDSPDPSKPFAESFASEVTELGNDVSRVLGGGSSEPAPAPEAPRLTSEKSDAWMAEQISKPGAPRLKQTHTVVVVREGSEWRIVTDPLDPRD